MEKFNAEKLKKLRNVDRIFKSFFIFRKNPKDQNPVVISEVKEVVIIAMFMIGDTIMSIPALTTIKTNTPGAKITLIGGKHVKLILEGQGLVDTFVTVNCPWLSHDYSFKNISSFFRSLKLVNRIKYDLAIDFRGDWRNIFYMNFINSSRKVSFNYSGGEYMLTDVVEPDWEIKHYIDEWLHLLEQLGYNSSNEDKYPALKLTGSKQPFLAAFKQDHGLNNTFVIGVHPGASLPTRKWDEVKYARLLIKLATAYEYRLVIFEGPGENDTVMKIEECLLAEGIKALRIKENLENYLTLINCCDLLICNDSGAGHIAGAFSIPSVVIFGSADPETVKPYNRNHIRIISHLNSAFKQLEGLGNKEYLDSIAVEEVYETVADLIDTLQEKKKIETR